MIIIIILYYVVKIMKLIGMTKYDIEFQIKDHICCRLGHPLKLAPDHDGSHSRLSNITLPLILPLGI